MVERRAITVTASRWPKRRAVHRRMGIQRKAMGRFRVSVGKRPPNTSSPTTSADSARRIASCQRVRSRPRLGRRIQRRISGATMRSPARSPSHHVSQMDP
jgi:hypothetical protein